MAYTATVFNVMIASPGDVNVERGLAREVIHEWNAIHSRSREMALMPIGWETHSHPSMEDRAQGVLNNQILKGADLLVAIFWTRIGTPTGKAVSGSVEEIEEHLKSGKPAMLYFSTAPVRMDSVDEVQYRKLREFKEEMRQRGLLEEYDTPGNFGEKFRRHLATKINDEEYFRQRHESNDNQAFVTNNIVDEVLSAASNKIPTMSESAKNLLVEASLDRGGNIAHLRYIDGVSISTNGKEFIEKDNPRSRANWEGALNELEALGLIEDLGHKGEIYQITREGYDVAELLRSW